MKHLHALAVLTAAVALSACGGGSGTPVEPPAAANEVPAAAMASTAALVDWSAAQPASETKDPLDLTKAMPPTSETEEPRAI